MEQEMIVSKPNGSAIQRSLTPMELLQTAIEKGIDTEQLSKLMDMQERYEAREAKKKFDAAMEKFKTNPPPITKNKHVRMETQKGVVEYDHATLDNVTKTITGSLSTVGIRHNWKTEQTATMISVTCVLAGYGHEERTTLSAPPDATGAKNTIQQIASTVSYLERYTLLAAVGMATADMDNDGHKVDKGWLSERLEWIANCSTAEETIKIFQTAYKDAQKLKDTKAMGELLTAKNNRKKELL